MFREAGTQVSPVTMSRPSPRTTAPPCLPLGIKDSLKEDARLLFWGLFAFALRLLLFGFLMGKALGLLDIWCGRFLEGKRIAEGELLASLRAKTLRKLKRTLYISFRKAKLKKS
jgi:hypothetical protein